MSSETKSSPPQQHETPRVQEHAASGSAPAVAQQHGHTASGSRRDLLVLAMSALGVVYGDIGTSPLYALRECFHGRYAIAPTPGNILGVLSLIFWSLIIVITIKYIIFILRADNHGEGGILALAALATPIRRYVPSVRPWIVLLGVFGAALLYGDGIITPAISVLSAVEGLTIATPLFEPYVIPLTVSIIVGLFVIQRGGTARIGQFFGPIMLLWFGVLAVLGITNAIHNPTVFTAVNPLYGVRFFADNGWQGFLILGTVFLVVTGGEALYADMGHFGRPPIRLAWVVLVLPALLLNYFGQGALLLREPEAAENVFYLLAPAWALYPLVGLATMATIIASQALISGAFSLTMQAEHLGMLPRVQIVHTSPTAYGQIYIPFVNWTLMVACILVVIGFRTSSNLAAAYGIAVTSTMAITTIIFAVVARRRWRWATGLVALVAGFFLVVDTAFLAANLVKIPQGGWFPLVIAALLIIVMTTWRRGNQLVFAREQDLELSLSRLLERITARPPHRVPGMAIFLSANPLGAPAALLTNMRDNGVLHEHVLLLSVRTGEVPHVAQSERVMVEPLGHGIYRGTIRYGFMEEPNVPLALAGVTVPELRVDPQQVPYFVSRTRVIATALPGMALWREQLFTLLRRNAASPADFFCLPPGRVFEIGTTVAV